MIYSLICGTDLLQGIFYLYLCSEQKTEFMGVVGSLFFLTLLAVSAVIGVWLEKAEKNR
jgi:hypothetical protein